MTKDENKTLDREPPAVNLAPPNDDQHWSTRPCPHCGRYGRYASCAEGGCSE